MKLSLYLDTAICLDAENPERDLKQFLLQQITSLDPSVFSRLEQDIAIVSGLQETILAVVQRKNYCEEFLFLPEGTVLVLEIVVPGALVQQFGKRINDGTLRIGHNRSLGYGLCHIFGQDETFKRNFIRYILEATVADGILAQGGVLLCEQVKDHELKGSVFAKDIMGRTIVPAATIKGAIRAQCQRLAAYFGMAEDVIDHMFGSRAKEIDAGVVFYDALITDAKEKASFRCHVDKLTGGVFGDGTGQMVSLYQTGKLQMTWDVLPLQNDIDVTAIHKLLLCVSQDIQQKRLSFGRGRGIGKGFLDVRQVTIDLPQEEQVVINYETAEVIDPAGWISRQWNRIMQSE